MINIVKHEGLNGNLLKIIEWVKQFGQWKIIEVKDMPSINEGIIIVFDLPLVPTGAYRIQYPKTELGQTEAINIKEYMLENTQVPLIFYGSLSVVEMLGGSLEFISSSTKVRNIKVQYNHNEYWAKGQRTQKINVYPDNMEALSRYIQKESIFHTDICAFRSKNVWCCNTVPYKFENLEGSHYRKIFKHKTGDPLSNFLITLIYEKESV